MLPALCVCEKPYCCGNMLKEACPMIEKHDFQVGYVSLRQFEFFVLNPILVDLANLKVIKS